MTLENGHSYDLYEPDLQYFITNTKFDKQINNLDTIFNFLNDMNYNINHGDKKSIKYYFIKDLIEQYYQPLQSYAGSGLNGEAIRSSLQSYTNQYVFLPSDRDKLVDLLTLLYFKKVGGKDSFLLKGNKS